MSVSKTKLQDRIFVFDLGIFSIYQLYPNNSSNNNHNDDKRQFHPFVTKMK